MRAAKRKTPARKARPKPLPNYTFDSKGVLTIHRLDRVFKPESVQYPGCCQAVVIWNLGVQIPNTHEGTKVVIPEQQREAWLSAYNLTQHSGYAITADTQDLEALVLEALGFVLTHEWDATTGSHLKSWVYNPGDQEGPYLDDEDDDLLDDGW